MSVSISQSRPVFVKRTRPAEPNGLSHPIGDFVNQTTSEKIVDVVYIHRSLFLDWEELQRNPAYIDSKAFANIDSGGQFEHAGKGDFIGAFFNGFGESDGEFTIYFSVPFHTKFKAAPRSLSDINLIEHDYELIVNAQSNGSPAVFKTEITADQFESEIKERFPIAGPHRSRGFTLERNLR